MAPKIKGGGGESPIGKEYVQAAKDMMILYEKERKPYKRKDTS